MPRISMYGARLVNTYGLGRGGIVCRRFMATITSSVDIVFDKVLHISVGIVEWFLRLYVPDRTESERDASEGEMVTDVSEEVPQTFKTVRDILGTPARVGAIGQKHTVMYAHAPQVSVYKNPTIEFDARVATIPYGEMVLMIEPQGRFFKVVWNEIEGWVLREDLADRAIRVYPEFTIGQENSVDHPNTAHVRTIINDEFGMGRSEFPLQAGEYVLYRLWKKGIRIDWPPERPRVPGAWHRILRGVPRVHASVASKVGSIMEYVFEHDIGHLAYVEAVFPDETITISEVNYPDLGIYNERELTKEEWTALKPVFITVEQ